ncbi:sporulation lipoprotein, YhcN/YlaJ family [Chlamydia abortus]|uniref:YhcN/YlaJ family sporulation lipoprotein n=1 Tax=Paenibacillus residui TaxID=629724 RepID=A0ABW3D935_9BACL|nr:sporulation lipoprotein, YhcN/YlaJ family [Chlamydia abortus]
MRMLLVIALVIVMLSGCQTAGQTGASSGGGAPSGNQVQSQQTNPDQQPMNNDAIATHLETIVKSIPQVEDATCVVMGNTAIVGINVKPDLDRARVDSIKYSAAEALRKDKYGVNALVTADLDMGQRIREMREDIQKGRPMAGFAEELGDIIGRIMPQVPQDITPADSPPPQQKNQQ